MPSSVARFRLSVRIGVQDIPLPRGPYPSLYSPTLTASPSGFPRLSPCKIAAEMTEEGD